MGKAQLVYFSMHNTSYGNKCTSTWRSLICKPDTAVLAASGCTTSNHPIDQYLAGRYLVHLPHPQADPSLPLVPRRSRTPAGQQAERGHTLGVSSLLRQGHPQASVVGGRGVALAPPGRVPCVSPPSPPWAILPRRQEYISPAESSLRPHVQSPGLLLAELRAAYHFPDGTQTLFFHQSPVRDITSGGGGGVGMQLAPQQRTVCVYSRKKENNPF